MQKRASNSAIYTERKKKETTRAAEDERALEDKGPAFHQHSLYRVARTYKLVTLLLFRCCWCWCSRTLILSSASRSRRDSSYLILFFLYFLLVFIFPRLCIRPSPLDVRLINSKRLIARSRRHYTVIRLELISAPRERERERCSGAALLLKNWASR